MKIKMNEQIYYQNRGYEYGKLMDRAKRPWQIETRIFSTLDDLEEEIINIGGSNIYNYITSDGNLGSMSFDYKGRRWSVEYYFGRGEEIETTDLYEDP